MARQRCVIYCEDKTLAQVATELNNPRVRASSRGLPLLPGPRDPEGRAHYATALARRDYLIDMRYSAYSGEEAPSVQGNPPHRLGRNGVPPH